MCIENITVPCNINANEQDVKEFLNNISKTNSIIPKKSLCENGSIENSIPDFLKITFLPHPQCENNMLLVGYAHKEHNIIFHIYCIQEQYYLINKNKI